MPSSSFQFATREGCRLRLHQEAKRGNLQEVKQQIQFVDVDTQDALGRTALHIAALEGQGSVVGFLIENNADVFINDDESWTALHAAAEGGNSVALGFILERALDLEATLGRKGEAGFLHSLNVHGQTALHRAALRGHSGVTSILVRHGAELDAHEKLGQTPLHWAAFNGHLQVAKILVKEGASLNVVSHDGNTPLHIAASLGHKGVVTLLVGSGATIDPINRDGESPLFSASSLGHEDCVATLLQRGANPNQENRHGWTPLHRAALRDHQHVVELLLRYGAYTRALNSEQKLPIDLAKSPNVRILLRDGWAGPDLTPRGNQTVPRWNADPKVLPGFSPRPHTPKGSPTPSQVPVARRTPTPKRSPSPRQRQPPPSPKRSPVIVVPSPSSIPGSPRRAPKPSETTNDGDKDSELTLVDEVMLKNLFKKYDRNQSGGLSRAELRTLLLERGDLFGLRGTAKEAANILKLFDTNNDATVSFNEFSFGMKTYFRNQGITKANSSNDGNRPSTPGSSSSRTGTPQPGTPRSSSRGTPQPTRTSASKSPPIPSRAGSGRRSKTPTRTTPSITRDARESPPQNVASFDAEIAKYSTRASDLQLPEPESAHHVDTIESDAVDYHQDEAGEGTAGNPATAVFKIRPVSAHASSSPSKAPMVRTASKRRQFMKFSDTKTTPEPPQRPQSASARSPTVNLKNVTSKIDTGRRKSSGKKKKSTKVSIIRELFDKYDRNQSGNLSQGEIRTLLRENHFHGRKATSEEARRLLKEMDSDNDGSVDYGEFKAVMRQWLDESSPTAKPKVKAPAKKRATTPKASSPSGDAAERSRTSMSDPENFRTWTVGDVVAWVASIGLPQYCQQFANNDVSGEVLSSLNTADFKEMGISSIGHRKLLTMELDRLQGIEDIWSTSRVTNSSLESPVGTPQPSGEGSVDGRYKFLKPFEETGSVRTAMDTITNGLVALKFLSDEEEFLRETMMLRSLNSDYVPKLLDVHSGSDPSEQYLVIEKGDQTLWERICARNLRPTEIKDIFYSVCKAIQHIHAMGIVHGDVKPSNIMRFGNQWKVVDLNCAHKSGDFMSIHFTPNYSAPEIASAFSARRSGLFASKTMDTWSLGMLLLEMHTGLTLSDFEGVDDPQRILEGRIPDTRAIRLLKQLLVKDPDMRLDVQGILEQSYLSDRVDTVLRGELQALGDNLSRPAKEKLESLLQNP